MASLLLLGLLSAILLPPWLVPGSSLRFDRPFLLLLGLLVPVVIARALLERRNGPRLRFPLAGVLARSGTGWRSRLAPLSTALQAGALALLAVAAARPQDSSQRQNTSLEGIDIVLTLDVSGSMQATDLRPTRLEASKSVVQDFIKRRSNDRMGAVVFASDAFTLCPLTLDYSVLASMIQDIQIGVIDDKSTAIGNAVGVAINRLRKSDAKSKAIILLTDGSSNAGNISPEQATAFARTMGIKIYTVLMGQKDQAEVASGLDFFARQMFGQQNVPINRDLLVSISEQTNGAFFEATDRSALESSFHSILDALERARIEDQGVVYAEVFGRYLFLALMLLCLEVLLAVTVLRRVP
jgi:Ca-activated chloride channel family protein